MTIDQIENEVLKLPQHERARLARRLLSSLDEDSELEKAWYDEAECRLAELKAGEATEIPAEEVFGSIGIPTER